MIEPLNADVLPAGVSARFVDGVNGLRVHLLEAGEPGAPCVLLLHGFPELAYSWRRIIPALASAGYHVIAPDQRGHGRTTGWDPDYDGDVASFRQLNLTLDVISLLAALGIKSVHAVVGHDSGAAVAGWSALLRPDLFHRVAMMSAPFAGPPPISHRPSPDIHAALAALDRPRKHYQWYYSTREANADMWRCRQGLHAFMRAYYHHKSADWAGNNPFRLAGWTAAELAKMPTYYIMDHGETMAETVAHEMPDAAAIAACAWLPDHEMRVYSTEYGRTGFQGGLQWYRCRTSGIGQQELRLFSGRRIEVPALFVAGARDWGIYQFPGAIERMQTEICAAMRDCILVDGAGHWVQQEQPQAVIAHLLDFMKS